MWTKRAGSLADVTHLLSVKHPAMRSAESPPTLISMVAATSASSEIRFLNGSNTESKSKLTVGGRYRLVEKIGSGNFGHIYKGVNQNNGKVRKKEKDDWLKSKCTCTALRKYYMQHEFLWDYVVTCIYMYFFDVWNVMSLYLPYKWYISWG